MLSVHFLQVALGVVPRNENKNEKLLIILQEMSEYVPQSEGHKYKTCILAGDQLTTERCRSLQMIRATSSTQKERLEGLHPTHADWHAEVIFLQVYACMQLLSLTPQ